MVLITIDVTPNDLANMRFGYNPLMELLNSYCLLSKPDRQAPLRRWVDEATQAISGVDLPYLRTIGSIPHYTPDFLTATPATTITDIEDEFERLRHVPLEVIRKNMSFAIQLAGESENLLQFMAYPREMIECLIEDMRLYWQMTLSHHWSHMMSVLDGDVLYRARSLALEGTKALFSGLHPELKLNGDKLIYTGWENTVHVNHHMSLRGTGLQLVPEIFAHKFSWQIEPEWHPMLIYKARGTGLWWRQNEPAPDESLEIALGAGRARVLRVLATPSSTGEIAHQLEITAGAASQHLSRLQQAGLTEPQRSGQRVYYHLTRRGEKLLALFI
ncbi:MAG: winged helix-turn-helix transcriptional regulator [Anaerolineae bacterium]|nr:winged helix-turn-helix transcriptional regulator [Anaerolineae bacterium]